MRTGTHSGEGKTWVSTQLIKALVSQGVKVTPGKPRESCWDTNHPENTDSFKLASAANKLDTLGQICPYRFKAPLSPPRAAALENQSITTDQIAQHCLNNVNNDEYLIVEGAGGFYSPLTANGLNADVAQALNLPVVLVVNDKLGCINHTLLTYEAIQQRGLTCAAVILNQISATHDKDMQNADDLKSYIDSLILHMHNQDALTTLIQHLKLNTNKA